MWTIVYIEYIVDNRLLTIVRCFVCLISNWCLNIYCYTWVESLVLLALLLVSFTRKWNYVFVVHSFPLFTYNHINNGFCSLYTVWQGLTAHHTKLFDSSEVMQMQLDTSVYTRQEFLIVSNYLSRLSVTYHFLVYRKNISTEIWLTKFHVINYTVRWVNSYL